jgi:peptidoglycan hydrolase CwlO-like protein
MRRVLSVLGLLVLTALIFSPAVMADKCQEMRDAANAYFKNEQAVMQMKAAKEDMIARDNERLRNHNISESAYKNNKKMFEKEIKEFNKRIKHYTEQIDNLQKQINKQCR